MEWAEFILQQEGTGAAGPLTSGCTYSARATARAGKSEEAQLLSGDLSSDHASTVSMARSARERMTGTQLTTIFKRAAFRGGVIEPCDNALNHPRGTDPLRKLQP